MVALTRLQLRMANGVVPACEYGPCIIRALMCEPSHSPVLRQFLSAPSRWVGPSVACTLLDRDSPAPNAFSSDSEARLLPASWFLPDAHDPVRGANPDEPRVRMIECLLFVVPSSLLPPGANTLVTYQHLLTGLCDWASQSRSDSLRVLSLALLQIPVALLPCRPMCAELSLELGWGAPFPDVVHSCVP